MSERLPVCDCAEYYGSHPPDCPVRTLIESLQSQLTEALKPRVCRYRRKDRPTGDLSPRYWVSENCGRMEGYRPDRGYCCRQCGGKIEVVG